MYDIFLFCYRLVKLYVKTHGKHIGRDEYHGIQCIENATIAGNSSTGHALHIGGIIVSYDR